MIKKLNINRKNPIGSSEEAEKDCRRTRKPAFKKKTKNNYC